jgi:hypothetical protein
MLLQVANRFAVNTTLSLLSHAFGLLAREPMKTISVVAPALVLMMGIGIITALTAPELLALDPAKPDLQSIKSVKLSIILLCTFVLSYALMAILWHRHTLSGTREPQPMCTRLVCGYLWRVMALALIQLAAGLALVVPLLLANHAGAGANEAPTIPAMMLTTFVTQLLILWFSLRLSLILPAAALGRPISMMRSWEYTEQLARALWGVAAVLAIINTTLTAVTALFDLARPMQALLLELPIYIIEGLLVFSVLTTLYSKQIQKDEL